MAEQHHGGGKKAVRMVRGNPVTADKMKESQENQLKQTEDMLSKVKELVDSIIKGYIGKRSKEGELCYSP